VPDIFSRNVSTLGGVFTSDRGRLIFAGDPSNPRNIASALVQTIQFTYSQTVTRLWEVGGDRVYYVGGRTAGQAAMSRVIGPTIVLGEFYRKYGNICNAASNNIRLALEETDCSPESQRQGSQRGEVSVTLKLCVLTAISAAVNAQDMIINENAQIMFSSLVYEDRFG